MRVLLIIIFLLNTTLSFGQLKSGFDADEVKQTLAMCNSFNFIEQFGSANSIIPKEFNLSYTSDILSMNLPY